MVDKLTVFNLALNALLIDYQATDVENDKTKQMKNLRLMYPLALSKTLADLDLNRTATKIKLELKTDTHVHWQYVYKYPSNSAKFRRIVSPFAVDNFETRIPFATETIAGVDVVLSNEPEAYGEIQPTNLNLSVLNPNAAIAVGYQLAWLSASLIAGKAGKELRKQILQEYTVHKAEAMEDDLNENVDFTPDEFKSEFAQARLGGKRWPIKIS